ncbi:FAT domain-containing protein, partial [Pavlovales sp. CCMP2436]
MQSEGEKKEGRESDVDSGSAMLRTCLRLLQQMPRLLDVAEARKPCFQALVLLIDRSHDVEVLSEVLKTLAGWLLSPAHAAAQGAQTGGSGLSLKERANFVLKLLQLESLHAPELQRRFLRVVHSLYSHPAAHRAHELLPKIERAFMAGLRASDPSLRAEFFALYDGSIGRSPRQRVEYILQLQDWESLAGTFWLRQALELLLTTVDAEAPVRPAAGSLRLPTAQEARAGLVAGSVAALAVAGATELGAGGVGGRGFAAEAAMLVGEGQRHLLARAEAAARGGAGGEAGGEGAWSRSLLGAVRELLHHDESNELAASLWAELFPAFWATLREPEQVALVKPIMQLLAKDHHRLLPVGAGQGPHVVQALMAGLGKCEPCPKLQCVSGLELHAALSPSEPEWLDALADLYEALGEHDAWHGLWQRRAAHSLSRAALSHEQYGQWVRAQTLYVDAMRRAQLGELSAGKAELSLWEGRWVQCVRQLNQWEALRDYVRAVPQHQPPQLVLECLWRTPDWAGLTDAFAKSPLPESAQLKLYQTYATLQEGGVAQAETQCNQGIALALRQWSLLPPLAHNSHMPLLHLFQQFQELQESAQLLLELQAAQRSGLPPELHSILTTWRERLPNEFDPLPAWSELATWRNHMFAHINSSLQSMADITPSLAIAGYEEMIWTVVQFAHVTRQHGMHAVCLGALSKLPQVNTLGAQQMADAFLKLREQLKCYRQMPPADAQVGLALISATNLDYFAPKHTAELLRLKGDLYISATAPADSPRTNAAYAAAVSLDYSLAPGWLAWAKYCDRLSGAKPGAEAAAWRERAIVAYTQALRGSSASAPLQIPRLLRLLATEAEVGGDCDAFAKLAPGVPTWLWLRWLPQLTAALGRPEAVAVWPLLLLCARVHPQPTYLAAR